MGTRRLSGKVLAFLFIDSRKGMEEPDFVKCELGWLSFAEDSCNLGKYMRVSSDHLEIKTEPEHSSSKPSIEEASTDSLKGEIEIEVHDPLFSTDVADDKQAALKVEACPVLVSETVKEAGASAVSEEHEIQDVKIETQNKEYNALEDTLQDVENASVLTREILHKCDVCYKTFNWRCTLERHSVTHTGDKCYQCAICNGMFTRKDTLKAHVLNHSRDKPFLCSFCGSFFTRLTDLKRHEVIHAGGPLSCSICGITFTRSSELRRHENAHNDYRPFSCTICGCTFKNSSTLKCHSIIHSDSRPYSCSICGSTFKHSSILKRHEIIHTDSRPFSCSICGNTFIRASHLKTHYSTHTETSSFFCTICGITFRRSSDLRNHEKTH